MGNFFTVNLEENFKKNQDFLQSIDKVMMERQIQHMYQMQERQMALALARSRDFFLWFGTFYGIAATGMITGYRKTKRPYLIAPLVPLTMVTMYYWDLAYGNKMHRIRLEAEHIMTHEADRLEWPCGLPTAASIDLGRLKEEEKKKIHPPAMP